MESLTSNSEKDILENMEESEVLYSPIIELLKQKQIPEAYPKTRGNSIFNNILGMSSLYLRGEIVENSCFCLLAKDWIEPLAEWIGQRKCLEIMAGSGALSKVLHDCGTDIKATDDFSWNHNESSVKSWFSDPWTKVEKLNAIQAIEKYGTEIDLIICSWPPYKEPVAYNALLKMREVNPNAMMIYIGELYCGCTANNDFFKTAQYVEDKSFDNAVKNFKRAYGMRDYPYLIK